MITKRIALLAVTVATLAGSQPALTEGVPPPPLRPGEFVVVLADGCSLIVGGPSVTPPDKRQETRAYYAQASWRGECRGGLVHGNGVLVQPAQGVDVNVEFVFGRGVYQGKSRSRGVFRQRLWSTLDGRMALITDENEFENPVWYIEGSSSGPDEGPTKITVGSRTTYPNVESCPSSAPPSCRPKYSIRTDDYSDQNEPADTPCPNPRTSVGCEVLWRQIAAPYFAEFREIRAQAERDEADSRARLIAELTPLNAAREARLAALDAEGRQAMARTRAAAQADAGESDQQFQAQLSRASAGQLFILGDEAARGGDNGKALKAWQALITRFPDHALSAQAAQRLATLGPATGQACDAAAQEARLTAGLTAAMGRIPRSNAVWQLESVMWTADQAAAAYARCPTLSNSQAKVNNYTTVYLKAARRCAQASRTGSCAAQMH
ncbi:MAG: hypothetical protein K1X35_14945 [Caulobacteraceae bacterium]|nr:hypothetical protein [Caulobacteraceae bacterium]